MRRWLLILLIAFLPLQFSWAAVASLCAHEETPAQARHFGHHEHEHKDASGVDDHTTKKSVFEVDEDCAYCHLGCAQPLPMAPFALSSAPVTPQVSVQSSLHDSHFPPGLERPDRRLA